MAQENIVSQHYHIFVPFALLRCNHGRGLKYWKASIQLDNLRFEMIYSSLCIYKPSAVGQPTRPTQPFILSGSSCNQAAIIALGGSAIWCALYEVKAGVVYFA